MRRLCAVAIGLALAVGATPARSETLLFPMPAGIQPQVEFWKRVYTDVDQSGGYLHDSRDLSVIYERLSFPSGLSHRARERRVKAARKRIEATLARLARGHRRGLSAEERRILALFPEDVTATTLRAAAKRVRFQRGQADKFRAGLVRMGRWEGFIRQVLLERGLPAGLVALPHVESSYNPKAYSKVGASGLWQFTRPTGRRYMRVDHVVDERRDPFLSTVAAARLLKHNYELTGSWPLAITAYNHGASGMRRAVRQLGTDDIAEIVAHYKSRSFGFASRNFYTSFLAALEIETQPERYFGEIAKDPPDEPEIVVLDHFYKANSLAQALGLSLEQMREYNPALLGPVWEGRKLVPARYGLRIPRENATPARVTLASIPTGERYAEQIADRRYRVRRGDSLSRIARRFNVSESALVRANGLRSRHRIRVGQLLEIPGRPSPRKVARVASSSPEPRPADNLYRVRRGDNIAAIASRFGVSKRDLVALNRLRNPNRIAVGQVLQIPGGAASASPPNGEPGTAGVYTVRKGDTLHAIAARFGVRERQIVALNGLRRPDHLRVGQVLHMPAGAADAAAHASDAPQAKRVAASEPVAPTPEPGAVAEAPPGSGEAAAKTEPPPSPTPGPDAEPASSTPVAPAAPPAKIEIATNGSRTALDGLALAVAGDGTIRVLPDETIGHYAEWLETSARALRDRNRLRSARSLPLGKRIALDFSHVSRADFETRRRAHHEALRDEFFSRYAVTGTERVKLRRGDSLWELARRHRPVPMWLLLRYNPELDPARLQAGQALIVPRVAPRG